MPWNWSVISMHVNITMDDIEQNLDKPWDWSDISDNPNITIEFIEKYIDKLDVENLAENHFTYENKRYRIKESYWVLEKYKAFNKTENLVMLDKYM